MFSRSYRSATGMVRIKVRDCQRLPITVRPSVPGYAGGGLPWRILLSDPGYAGLSAVKGLPRWVRTRLLILSDQREAVRFSVPIRMHEGGGPRVASPTTDR